jgi:filamentous hemagglutinin family protein
MTALLALVAAIAFSSLRDLPGFPIFGGITLLFGQRFACHSSTCFTMLQTGMRGLIWAIAQSGVVAVALAIGLADGVIGQIVPDDTLGAERSQVTAAGDRIEGGAQRGQNLFHSFREFNVGTGQQVYFANPATVRNIFSRVTGTNVSNIDGILGVDGGANLFLMNPNGIVFGQNARLDVGGSFVGTTANAIGFRNQGFFSATNPETPLPLLAIEPSAFLFNQLPTGNIVVNSNAPIGLRVPDGQNLLLLGGNVTIDGGQLNAFGGHVEIGAVAGVGAIGLNADDSFSFPVNVPRADVLFTNGSKAYVFSDKGGNICITAGNIDIWGRSTLLAGIYSDFGALGNQAGDITLNATDNIQIGQGSRLVNNVRQNAVGNGGNLNITTGYLSATGGSLLSASTFGQGNAGRVIINARNRASFDNSNTFSNVEENASGQGGGITVNADTLSLINGSQLSSSAIGTGNAGSVVINAHDRVSFGGRSADGHVSGVFSRLDSRTSGKGGNIEITTGTLSLTNGAQLSSSTFGQGDSGDILIRANHSVSLADYSAILSGLEDDAVGNGGSINIETGSLAITDSQIFSSVRNFAKGLLIGRHNAGNINIDVQNNMTLNGSSVDIPARIASSVLPEGTGKAGNININAGTLTLNNIAIVNSNLDPNAIGIAGNIEIQAGSLFLNGGSRIEASTRGQGNAGNIFIHARDAISLNGAGNFSGQLNSTAINSNVLRGANGTGGNITIQAASLFVTDGAQLITNTLGRGKSGNIIINTHGRVVFDATNANRELPTGASTAVERTGNGQGGNIQITAGSLDVINGAQLQALTSGQGNAGNITLNIADEINLSGSSTTNSGHQVSRVNNINLATVSGLFANTDRNSTGQAGDINIRTRQLNIRDNAEVAVNSRGTGQAGNLTVSANDIQLDRGILTAETRSTRGNGANIRLQDIDRLLYLQNGSQISATAFDDANGGNVTINADNGFIVARTGANQDNDIIARANGGNGGQVAITAQGILGLEERPSTPINTTNDIDVSSDQGLQGTVTLNIPNVDPSRGLTELPTTPIDATRQVASACPTNTQQADRLGNFIVSGRGGLPPSPTDLLSPDNLLSEWVTPGESGNANVKTASPPETQAIVEAQGWVRDAQGKVRLVAASAPAAIVPASCPQR